MRTGGKRGGAAGRRGGGAAGRRGGGAHLALEPHGAALLLGEALLQLGELLLLLVEQRVRARRLLLQRAQLLALLPVGI